MTRRRPGTTGSKYVLPAPIDDLDSRFFRSDAGGRREGGLFGLDGIHPTTSGYGIIAQAVLDVLDPAGSPARGSTSPRCAPATPSTAIRRRS